MNTRNAADLTRALHAHFCNGELPACLELAHPEIEAVLQPALQSFHGREGFLQFMSSFKTAFPDIEMTHTHLVASGDDVAVEFVWNGTHTGPLVSAAGTIPPTGRRVEGARVAEFLTWRDGRLIRLVNYQDLGNVLRALGVL